MSTPSPTARQRAATADPANLLLMRKRKHDMVQSAGASESTTEDELSSIAEVATLTESVARARSDSGVTLWWPKLLGFSRNPFIFTCFFVLSFFFNSPSSSRAPTSDLFHRGLSEEGRNVERDLKRKRRAEEMLKCEKNLASMLEAVHRVSGVDRDNRGGGQILTRFIVFSALSNH